MKAICYDPSHSSRVIPLYKFKLKEVVKFVVCDKLFNLFFKIFQILFKFN